MPPALAPQRLHQNPGLCSAGTTSRLPTAQPLPAPGPAPASPPPPTPLLLWPQAQPLSLPSRVVPTLTPAWTSFSPATVFSPLFPLVAQPPGPHLPPRSLQLPQPGRSGEHRLLPASGSIPPEVLATSPALPRASSREPSPSRGCRAQRRASPSRGTPWLPTAGGPGRKMRACGFSPGTFYLSSISQISSSVLGHC